MSNIYIETPQIYGRGQQKGDQNHILGVGLMAGALCGRLQGTLVAAQEWKGDTPKNICHKRLRAKYPGLAKMLDETFYKNQHEHILDALGLALYARNKNIKK
jgi:hypothetical protein